MTDQHPELMGSPEDACSALTAAAGKWREYRQPLVATTPVHRKREAGERGAVVWGA